MASEAKIPLGIYLSGSFRVQEAIKTIQLAEKLGFDQAWKSGGSTAIEPVTLLSAIAQVTNRIQIGTGIIPIWTRNIVTVATTFSTLYALFPGRVLCGLGAWEDPIASMFGIDMPKPLTAMREMITTLRRLWKLEKVTFKGQHVRIDNIQLRYAELDRSLEIPVYIGATGDRMLALAAEIADGVLFNYLVTPEYMDRAFAIISKASRIETFDRPQLIHVYLDEDGDNALKEARKLVAQHVPLTEFGVPEDLKEEIKTRLEKNESLEAVSELVPDGITRKFVAAGTAIDCYRKLKDLVKHGATCPVLLPVTADASRTLREIAELNG